MAVVSKIIKVHAVESGKVPAMQSMLYATGQTFVNGEILIYSSGNVIVGTTGLSSGIVGVAGQGAGTAPGYDVANAAQTTTYTGRRQAVTVFRPNDQTIFAAQLTNNSSTLVTPTQADIGASYGLTLYTGLGTTPSRVWAVDKNLNNSVVIEGIDADQLLVFFKFKASVLAG